MPPETVVALLQSGQNSIGEDPLRQSRDVLELETSDAVRPTEERGITSSARQSFNDNHSSSHNSAGKQSPSSNKDQNNFHRRSRMPTNPTQAKAVRFDAHLEHICYFSKIDKPQAVSSGSSLVEDRGSNGDFPSANRSPLLPFFEWKLLLSNFSQKTLYPGHQHVLLERLFLLPDNKFLIGIVVVANLAYKKHVVARFTFDNWKTTSEVTADYSPDVSQEQVNNNLDRLVFSINLSEQENLEMKTMFVCIRYHVSGQDFWDNNTMRNYQVNFTKVHKPEPGSYEEHPSNPWVNRDDGMTEEADNPIPLRRRKLARRLFGSRYDFELSLNAEMRAKPDQDPTMPAVQAQHGPSPSPSPTRKANFLDSCHPERKHPFPLVPTFPTFESPKYGEFVNRYCYSDHPCSQLAMIEPLDVS